MSFIKYISNEQHYNEVLSLASACKESLCIGTADIKDLHVKVGDTQEPFLMIVAELLKRGVDVMLIHAKEPGPNFREDFDRFPILFTKLRRVLCPRVHFKILIFDTSVVYIGSANLTGAGMGMKSPFTRNFEAGILTDEPQLLEEACHQYFDVFFGEHCKKCKRRQYCTDPVK